MAIKPTDYIVWLNRAGYWKEEHVWWAEEKELVYYKPNYWQKFYDHAIRDLKPASLKWQYSKREHKHAIEEGLKPYGVEYKESKNDGPYLRFKSEADYLLFIMKWS